MKNIYFIITLFLSMPAMAQPQNDEETLLTQKTAAYSFANKLDLALDNANALVKKFPKTENFLVLASTYELRKDFVNADKYYKTALQSAGDNAAAVYHDLSFVMYRRKDVKNAIAYAHESLARKANQDSLHYFLATIYDSLKNIDSANWHYTRAYQLNNNNTDYLKEMYRIHYSNGMVRESLPYLEKVVILDTSDRQTKITLATGYVELDEYKKAVPLLQIPVGDSTAADSIYYMLAKCNLELGDSLTAVLNVEKAILLSKAPDIKHYDMLLEIYAAQGQYNNMLRVYEEGDKKGFAPYKQWISDYRESVDTMRIIYKDMDNGDVAPKLYLLGKLYLQINDFANSLKVLADFETVGGALTDSLYSLRAVADLNLNHMAEAKTNIEEAIRLAPANEDYRMLLMLIEYRLKNYQSVVNLSKQRQAKTGAKTYEHKETEDYLLYKSYQAMGNGKEAAGYHKSYQQHYKN